MPNIIINRIERLDYLIRTRSTGTPDQLARKLTLSRSRLYDYITLLKELGAPVKYDRKRNSFYYDEHGSFCFRFITEEKLVQAN